MTLFASCTRLLGWGVLLWSTENPPVPSGTVLPVYIRSNINQVWVVGVPELYRNPGDTIDKTEIPLSRLEFLNSRKAARQRAADFSEFALLYAETLQDGLPIREDPDNGSRRIYRLKQGQIVKVLKEVDGNPAISTTGEPLPGAWYQVLTEDGSTGYCFSYRLRLFEYRGGALAASATEEEEREDPDLEVVLSKVWSPESYGDMLTSNRIDLEELSNKWGFSPGQDLGLARIHTPDLDRTFSYSRIRADGSRSWRFEGAPLRMSLLSETVLTVQYIEEGGAPRSFRFVNLPADLETIIVQETGRRDLLFRNIYTQGPVFTSANYGTLAFSANGGFTWSGYNLLVPEIIPASVQGSGRVDMGIFLGPSLVNRYDGAFSLRFAAEGTAVNSRGTALHFLYTLDNQGFRLEYAPPDTLEGISVTRRAASPTVIYFFRSGSSPGTRSPSARQPEF
jgi:hypothetical protein